MPIKLPPARVVREVPNLSQPLPSSVLAIKCAGGEFRVDRVVLEGGRRTGVEIVVVDTGLVRAALLPTRGLSLWRANIGGLELGWRSPVDGPIHPQWVALSEAGGLGWLDGFDELLVRCGLRNFGAPDFDKETGRLNFPLHGRIGNLPSDPVELELDAEHSLLHVRGVVAESRFLQFNLRLQATYTFAIDLPSIAIADQVRNAGDTPTTMQMLYHINVGQPLLSAGAQLVTGAKRIVARNEHAANDIATWSKYLDPTPGYAEQVYFSASAPAADGWASAVLGSADKSRGFAVHYQTDTLPYFTQWKNTVGANDGYVTGLEPGTGFPNPRSYEEKQGRVVTLDRGETRDFNLKLEGITTAERLRELSAPLSGQPELVPFDADWCMPSK
ncbi:MAG: aldose 1-epimerase family protein [Pirellulaceae bacterium]|nr:aldose 1-epimerase family protein [Pirellulaceae bacterium]